MPPQRRRQNSRSSHLKPSPGKDQKGKRPLLLERRSCRGDLPVLRLGEHPLSPPVLVRSTTRTMARLPSGAVSPSPSYLFPHKKDISPSMLAEHLDSLLYRSSPETTRSMTPGPANHHTVPSLTPLPPPTNQTVYAPSRRGSPCNCPDRFVPPTPPLSPTLPLITAFKSETPSIPSARACSEGTSGRPLKTSPSLAATPLLLGRFSPLSRKRISSSMPCPVTPTMPRPRSPSPSHRELRPNTVWGHYLRTVGGHLPDPLYHHPSPRKRTTKKPLRYRLTPAERRDLDELVLEALPRPGRMLTRQLLGRIMDESKSPSGST